MSNKLLALMLIWFSSGALAINHAYGMKLQVKETPAAKIKREITRLGVDAPVILKLSDGRKLSGSLAEINGDAFVLLEPEPGDKTARLTNRTVIAYSEVKQVKYAGSTGGANLGPAFLIVGVVFLLAKLVH